MIDTIFFSNLVLLQTLYFFNGFAQIIFALLRKKVVEKPNFYQFIGLISLVLSSYIFLKWKCDISKRTYAESDHTKNYRLYAALYEGSISPILLLSIIIFVQWSRVTLVLRLSGTFGPMVELIIAMIKELFVFGFLYLLIFSMFLFTGTILFSRLNDFETFEAAAKYLFNASLGTFSFETFDGTMAVSNYFGYGFIILYVVFSNITLLNFLIAILSDIYGILKQKSSILYYQQIIKVRQAHDFNKYYSSLVCSPSPLNILIIPFIPFIVFCKSEKLNNILLYICYFPVMVVGILIFITMSFMHLPFSYLVFVKYQLQMLISKGFQKCRSFIVETAILLFIILFGIFYILLLQCVDLYHFAMALFSKNLQLKDEATQDERNGFSEIHPELFNCC